MAFFSNGGKSGGFVDKNGLSKKYKNKRERGKLLLKKQSYTNIDIPIFISPGKMRCFYPYL